MSADENESLDTQMPDSGAPNHSAAPAQDLVTATEELPAVEASDSDMTAPLTGFAAVLETPEEEPERISLLGVEERPAPVHLKEADQVADWVARAEWFEQHASKDVDVAARARTLTVASELWAMAGNDEQAQRTAEHAAKLNPGLGQRQARQLAAKRGDYKSVAVQLASEISTARTPAAKAHAAFYAAEIARVKLGDTSTALRHWEQGARAQPNDPRPPLFKLAKQMSTSSRPPSLRWPDQEELHALRDATAAASVMRSEQPQAGVIATQSPVVAFVEASKALRRGNRTEAADALLDLAQTPEFSRSASWLATALLAQSPTTRKRATEILTQLLQERGSAALRRVLAARALELGDRAAAQLALAEDHADDDADLAFTPTDHIAVGALCEAPAELLTPWLARTEQQDDLKPLAWAVVTALGLPCTPPEIGDSEEAALVALGEALGRAESKVDLEQVADAAERRAPAHPLLHLLRLEGALTRGDIARIATTLVDVPKPVSEENACQAHYAAGLLHERFGNTEAADDHYGRALRSERFGEAAARSLLARLPRERASKLLSTLADASRDPEHRSLLLLEAALTDGLGPRQADLCHAAMRANPASVLPPHLGEQCTIGGDNNAAARAKWIARQREQGGKPFEHALLLLREALLAQSTESRADRIEQAWNAWPKDLALAWLAERESAPSPLTKAKTREQLAALQKDPITQTQLLLEAAWLYETAGATQAAARAAEAAAPKQPLAHLCLQRTAPGHAQAKAVREQLLEQIETATSPAHTAELCLRLAVFEGQSHRPSEQLELLARAIEHVPDFIPALAHLESHAIKLGSAHHLLTACTRLANLLPESESLPLALIAARLERLENGWGAAYPLLKLTSRGAHTSAFSARQIRSHARVLGDTQVAYEMTLLLAERAIEPLDRAILLLRAAELAVLQAKSGDACRQLATALAICPAYLPALALQAQLLEEDELWVPAAEAREALAHRSRVIAHQVEHWWAAALLWLDHVGDSERGLHCLESANRLDPADPKVFERLEQVYRGAGSFVRLQDALDRRLQVTNDRDEIAVLQLKRSRALVASGDTQQARQALLAVIRASPENVQALTSLAELAERDGDALSAEHALLQLVRLNSDAGVQADVYARLAALYQGPLENPKRALRCYQEVLRRRPDDTHSFDAMLSAYADAGLTERAMELLEKQQSSASTKEQREELKVRVAELQARDPAFHGAAEQAYAELISVWPLSERVLRAAATFYNESARGDYVRDWCMRELAEVRNAYSQHSFDTTRAKVVEVLAEEVGESAVLDLTKSARLLLDGSPAHFEPATGRAMSRHIDGLLAPTGVANALRILLMQTRGILDQALELNLGPLAPRRVSIARVQTAFEVKARAMGIGVPEIFVTSVEPTLVLVTGNPSRVVLGTYWIDKAPPGALDFVAWRALKSDQARVGLFTQLDSERLDTVLLAFLSCFVDVRLAPPDRALFETTRLRVIQRLPKDFDDDLPVLALEVLNQIREAQPNLADAVCRWVNRSALLACGDPKSALVALDVLEQGAPGAEQISDIKTLLKTPQAMDLLTSMHGPEFVEAYKKTH
jgi:predicted Zn-dependent protease